MPVITAYVDQNLVHAKSHDLMGVMKVRDGDGPQSIVLPHPLWMGEQPCSAQDSTRLWNPDWRQDSTFPVNSSYLDAIADLILDQEKVILSTMRGSHCY